MILLESLCKRFLNLKLKFVLYYFTEVLKDFVLSRLSPDILIWFGPILCRLTEREKKEREHKRSLLTLAKEHEKARELEKVQRYHMPQDTKDVS